MSRNYGVRKRGKAKTVIVTALVVCAILIFGAFAVNLLRADTRTVGASAFSVGGLDETGTYIERSDAIYTKDLIECKGLKIERDFESNVSYQVFFYDEEEEFLEASELITEKFSDVPENAKYCRVMIVPEVPEDVEADEFEIGFFSAIKYAKQLTITVNRK